MSIIDLLKEANEDNFDEKVYLLINERDEESFDEKYA